MILMMIVMILPVIALPVFWVLPLGEAIPAYLACLALSGSMHWVMHASIKQPAKTGIQTLIGKEAKVISRSIAYGAPHYLVRVEGEIWSASCDDSFKEGETVVVAAVEGNKLAVKSKHESEQGAWK